MTAIYNCDLIIKGGKIRAGTPCSLTDEKHKQLIDAGIGYEIVPEDPPIEEIKPEPKPAPKATKKVAPKNLKKTKKG